MMRRTLTTLIALVALFAGPMAQAQELNCSVEINSDKVANVSKDIFNTLKQAITEYLNNTKWTDAQFMTNEKIQCKMFFTISEYNSSTNKMKGDLQVQSQRPVYNSSYTTTILNFKDTKIEFSYQENEPLTYSEQDWQSNLTGILNYWAYMIIAMDFDTFAPNGGDPYYEKAAQVVRMAQSTGESGWKAFEDTKNRSAVLSAFTDKATSGIRDVLYNYHRQGLDQMVTSVDKGRMTITQCLETLKQVYDAAPMSVCLSMFRDAKMDELVNIYSKANMTEKQKVYELLYPLYPTATKQLEAIKNENTEN